VSNDPDTPDATGNRGYGSVGGNTSVNIAGLTQATTQINQFNAAIASMQQQLTKFAQAAPGLSSTLSGSINKIGSSAQGSGGGMFSGAQNIVSSMFGSVNERGWARDLMMFPTRFMRGAIQDNRQMATMASAGLGSQAFASGTSTQNMMGALAGNFGNVLGGNPESLVGLMQIASQVGAGINWRGYTGGSLGGNMAGPTGQGQYNSPRATGFFRSVFEAQRMNPGADVGSLAASIGGYAGNVGAQQQSAFLTGGAFSMIGAGNRQKSISEWAEGILKWLQNLRGGPQRGQPFKYAELMSQNFPGSNMDAWLTANGVTPEMKQMFWTYALGQASTGHSSVDELFSQNSAVNSSVAFNRLQASAAETRTGFRLAGTMSGAYANKEQANQFFAELTGHLLNQVLPSAMSSGALSYMQYLPDTIEEIVMQMAERTKVGGAAAGLMGWGSGLSHLFEAGAGDVGDVGDYGPLGGTNTAGLHPDMRRKVDAMMAANPNVRVNSGLRDLHTQQKLKRKGVGRVSGRPSGHTRGMAADLGPRSQYGWIANNAGRFGLKSGRSQGEPWHVGMGDVGDIGEGVDDIVARVQKASSATDFLSMGTATAMQDFLGSMLGSLLPGSTTSPEDQIKGIGGASSAIMQALVGIFGGTPDQSRIAYRSNVYDLMVQAADKQRGLPTGMAEGGPGKGWLGNIFGGMVNTVQGILADSAAGPISGGGVVQGDFTSKDPLQRAIAAANAAYAAGWRGNDLFKILSIAGRETNWKNTHAYVPSTGDDSYGLTMINMIGSLGPNNRKLFGISSNEELLNPVTAMKASKTIHDQQNKYGGFYGWGPYKGRDELYDTADYEQPTAKAALAAAFPSGYGDTDGAGYAYTIPGGGGGSTRMTFNNHFQIDASGGGAGIDVRRTVTMLADQLEQEMNRRMAKRN
jgi:hypothetical protein